MAMKIPPENMIKVLQGLKQPNKPHASEQGRNKVESEKVDFSRELQQASQAERAAETTNPERAEKVQSLKQQIKDGTYQPDMREVAQSLLDYLSRTE